MPIMQWLYFDALECLPETEELMPTEEEAAPVSRSLKLFFFSFFPNGYWYRFRGDGHCCFRSMSIVLQPLVFKCISVQWLTLGDL